MANFLRSLAIDQKERPGFVQNYIQSNGQIQVKINEGWEEQVDEVVLRHTETFSSERRDFRFVRSANSFTNVTEPCEFPWIPLKGQGEGGNCLQVQVWKASDEYIEQIDPGVYVATPPEPSSYGKWVGYYVEVRFKGLTEHKSLFRN